MAAAIKGQSWAGSDHTDQGDSTLFRLKMFPRHTEELATVSLRRCFPSDTCCTTITCDTLSCQWHRLTHRYTSVLPGLSRPSSTLSGGAQSASLLGIVRICETRTGCFHCIIPRLRVKSLLSPLFLSSPFLCSCLLLSPLFSSPAHKASSQTCSPWSPQCVWLVCEQPEVPRSLCEM